MPTSPQTLADEEAADVFVGGKRRRSLRQKLRARYAKAREDAQLMGIIPTTPEGAFRDERVKPTSQEEQDTTSLDRKAIAQGWAVPEEEKQEVIERLLSRTESPDTSTRDLAACANALFKADQMQFERDHPERAAKAKGSTTIVTKVAVANVFDDIEKDIRLIEGVTETAGDLQTDGVEEPLDVAQPVQPEA